VTCHAFKPGTCNAIRGCSSRHYFLDAADKGPEGQHFFVEAHPGDQWQNASLIAHEFGHSLGLKHGGDEDYISKPNYPSIVNYAYQSNTYASVNGTAVCLGYVSDECPDIRRLDYSHGLMSDLDPKALDETLGMGYGPIDWNCDGEISETPVAHNILGGSRCSIPDTGETHVMKDFDDWSYLHAHWDLLAPRGEDSRSAASAEYVDGTNSIICDPPEEELVSCQCGLWPISNCYALPNHDMESENCSHPYLSDSDLDGTDDYCDRCPYDSGDSCCCDVPGDADGSSNRQWPTDRDYLIDYIYLSGQEPPCHDEGDVNGNGVINVVDIVFLNNYYILEDHDPYTPICGLTGH